MLETGLGLGFGEVVGGSWNMGMAPRERWLRAGWNMRKETEKWEKKEEGET